MYYNYKWSSTIFTRTMHSKLDDTGNQIMSHDCMWHRGLHAHKIAISSNETCFSPPPTLVPLLLHNGLW